MTLRVISLGAGVQSTTMALMAAHGEIGPMPDCAIFADTKGERRVTYEHLAWLETVLPFPVYHVSTGDLTADLLAGTNSTGHKFSPVPWFIPGNGMGRRQCTREYKIAPVRRKIAELVGTKKRPGSVEQWIGLSTDEIEWRERKSDVRYIVNRYPLVEAGLDRHACDEWLWSHYKRRAPKSACGYCPYQSNAQWRETKRDPVEWAKVIVVDRAIRSHGVAQYMHPECKPIDEVDLSVKIERQLNLFNNECEGMCGV